MSLKNVRVFKIKQPTYRYQVTKVVDVIDGDTVRLEMGATYMLDVDFGFNIKDKMLLTKSCVQICRLAGINAPEVKGDSKTAGEAAKKALATKLNEGPVTAFILGQDKYGRWLTTLERDMVGSVLNVNQWMIDNGYAVPYNP